MPDGSRRRRFSTNLARRNWYADSGAVRFARYLGFGEMTSVRRPEPCTNVAQGAGSPRPSLRTGTGGHLDAISDTRETAVPSTVRAQF
jgi:hypothetical protein